MHNPCYEKDFSLGEVKYLSILVVPSEIVSGQLKSSKCFKSYLTTHSFTMQIGPVMYSTNPTITVTPKIELLLFQPLIHKRM